MCLCAGALSARARLSLTRAWHGTRAKSRPAQHRTWRTDADVALSHAALSHSLMHAPKHVSSTVWHAPSLLPYRTRTCWMLLSFPPPCFQAPPSCVAPCLHIACDHACSQRPRGRQRRSTGHRHGPRKAPRRPHPPERRVARALQPPRGLPSGNTRMHSVSLPSASAALLSRRRAPTARTAADARLVGDGTDAPGAAPSPTEATIRRRGPPRRAHAR